MDLTSQIDNLPGCRTHYNNKPTTLQNESDNLKNYKIKNKDFKKYMQK